jgi:hypothetical protein
MKIKNLFKKRSYPESSATLEVLVITPKAKKLSDVLGISDKRNDEMLHIILKEYNKEPDLSEVLATLSKIAKHPNELAYMCYLLGGFVQRKKQEAELITSLLK